MFGSKEASEDKLKKMVEKGKWDKLRKQYLDSDKTTQVALAKACAASRNDGSVNILTSLLEVDDVDVKIAAVTSLGEVGDDHVTGAPSMDRPLSLIVSIAREIYLSNCAARLSVCDLSLT